MNARRTQDGIQTYGSIERVREIGFAEIEKTLHPRGRQIALDQLEPTGERFNAAILRSSLTCAERSEMLREGLIAPASPADLMSLVRKVPRLRDRNLLATASICPMCPKPCKMESLYGLDKGIPYRVNGVPTNNPEIRLLFRLLGGAKPPPLTART